MDTALWIVVAAALFTAIMTGAGALPFLFVRKVGVSFAGSEGLGACITTAIAFHNVPEGLAIALVLVPRGSPVWKAALWSIFTSLPQPITAAPAYLFVEAFRPFLPVGLGLAAGAMIWMVFSELFPEATEKVDSGSAATGVTLAFSAMMAVQMLVLAP